MPAIFPKCVDNRKKGREEKEGRGWHWREARVTLLTHWRDVHRSSVWRRWSQSGEDEGFCTAGVGAVGVGRCVASRKCCCWGLGEASADDGRRDETKKAALFLLPRTQENPQAASCVLPCVECMYVGECLVSGLVVRRVVKAKRRGLLDLRPWLWR